MARKLRQQMYITVLLTSATVCIAVQTKGGVAVRGLAGQRSVRRRFCAADNAAAILHVRTRVNSNSNLLITPQAADKYI